MSQEYSEAMLSLYRSLARPHDYPNFTATINNVRVDFGLTTEIANRLVTDSWDSVNKGIIDFQHTWEEQNQISCPWTLSAAIMSSQSLYAHHQIQLEHAFKNRDLKLFTCLYDLRLGLFTFRTAFIIGLDSIRGESDKQVVKVLHNVAKSYAEIFSDIDHSPFGDLQDSVINIYLKQRRQAKQYEKFILADPKGLLLAQHITDEASHQQDSTELYELGAYEATALYRKIVFRDSRQSKPSQ